MKYTLWHWNFAVFINKDFCEFVAGKGKDLLMRDQVVAFAHKIDFQSKTAIAHKDGWDRAFEITKNRVHEAIMNI